MSKDEKRKLEQDRLLASILLAGSYPNNPWGH